MDTFCLYYVTLFYEYSGSILYTTAVWVEAAFDPKQREGLQMFTATWMVKTILEEKLVRQDKLGNDSRNKNC